MRAAAEIVERRGARFVEACFTGSKGAAEKGELVYYVGGTDEALREARPILEASSKEIVEIGAVGQASAIKIATNMITAASVQAAAEALALVQALGVPLEKFVEAMRANADPIGTGRRLSRGATGTMCSRSPNRTWWGEKYAVRPGLRRACNGADRPWKPATKSQMISMAAVN